MLMVYVLMTSTTMELLPLMCLCLLTWSGLTFTDGNGQGVLVAIKEGSDAILPCSLSTKENIDNMVFDWKKDGLKEVFLFDAGFYYGYKRTGQDEQFKGRVFHFEDELKNGNASIKIKNTKMADNGSYTCIFPGQQTSHIILSVGAAPKPFITSLSATREWARLLCEVEGVYPEPIVEWRDSAGNILPAEQTQFLERENRFYVTLQITVNKTDRYRCIVTQKKIYHQIYAEIDLYINGKGVRAHPVWLFHGILVFVYFFLYL
ncbi:butyrophilin-like protein 1 isoform X2 [Anabas testudineus]|uniref:butyrophilin-like protein 1 isoform X2 n=1 Tax=Anabas testudineus TaxID=64144 RepID=UPI000E459AA5|nr:butyrophilin-like protein 1 isoform X2 [Anabas testudineus]